MMMNSCITSWCLLSNNITPGQFKFPCYAYLFSYLATLCFLIFVLDKGHGLPWVRRCPATSGAAPASPPRAWRQVQGDDATAKAEAPALRQGPSQLRPAMVWDQLKSSSFQWELYKIPLGFRSPQCHRRGPPAAATTTSPRSRGGSSLAAPPPCAYRFTHSASLHVRVSAYLRVCLLIPFFPWLLRTRRISSSTSTRRIWLPTCPCLPPASILVHRICNHSFASYAPQQGDVLSPSSSIFCGSENSMLLAVIWCAVREGRVGVKLPTGILNLLSNFSLCLQGIWWKVKLSAGEKINLRTSHFA